MNSFRGEYVAKAFENHLEILAKKFHGQEYAAVSASSVSDKLGEGYFC